MLHLCIIYLITETNRRDHVHSDSGPISPRSGKNAPQSVRVPTPSPMPVRQPPLTDRNYRKTFWNNQNSLEIAGRRPTTAGVVRQPALPFSASDTALLGTNVGPAADWVGRSDVSRLVPPCPVCLVYRNRSSVLFLPGQSSKHPSRILDWGTMTYIDPKPFSYQYG